MVCSLDIVCSALVLLTVFVCVWPLTLERIRDLVSAREVLRDYMQKQVRERKVALTDANGQERSDVFSLLVRANEEDGKFTLDADELVGVLLACALRSVSDVLSVPFGRLGTYSVFCLLVMVCPIS